MLEKVIDRLYEPVPRGSPRQWYGARNGAMTGAILATGVTMAAAILTQYAPELLSTGKPTQEQLDLSTIAYAGAIMIPGATLALAGAGYVNKKIVHPMIDRLYRFLQ